MNVPLFNGLSPSIRWILPLCLASFLWAFGFGVSAPLSSLWLQAAGVQDTLIGLNTATYYLGIVLVAGIVPRLLERWGYGCLLLGMLVSGLAIALFPWHETCSEWFALRGLSGAAGALSLVPLETYVNRRSDPDHRARNFGCYALCIALGMGLGTCLGMALYPSHPRMAFMLGAVTPLLGAAVVLAWKPSFPPTAEERLPGIPCSFFHNFLSFGSTWSQGFLEGGMVGLLPLYLLHVGLSETTASYLMGGLLIGAILAQLPVAWLADRLGRVALLATCNILTLLALGGLMISGGMVWLALCLFVVGACSGAFYPLGLALLGDRLPASALARGNARYLAINSFGSLTGPAVAGAAMDHFGRNALFLAGAAAVGLVFVFWLVLELRLRLVMPNGAGRRMNMDEQPLRNAA